MRGSLGRRLTLGAKRRHEERSCNGGMGYQRPRDESARLEDLGVAAQFSCGCLPGRGNRLPSDPDPTRAVHIAPFLGRPIVPSGSCGCTGRDQPTQEVNETQTP